GNVVVLSHSDDIKTYYASLHDVAVAEGDELAQGDLIGTAGKNLFGKDNGNHVHFELRKTGEEVNPEQYFNQPLSKLVNYAMDDAEEEEEEDENEEDDEELDSESTNE